MPHLTIVKMPDLAGSERALQISRKHWSTYAGPRLAQINELVFVREVEDGRWVDLAPLQLKEE